MKISLIHPSRSRVNKAFESAQLWIDRAGCKVDYTLSVDESDPSVVDYIKKFGGNVCIGRNKSAVDAINLAANASEGNIIVVMSDDFEAPKDWGKMIIEKTKGKTDWIAKTPDGIQSWLITLPIMDRTYYNRFGYIYHPDYAHMFCDTELTCVADLTGRKITLDIPFTHNHYSTGRSQKDEVSIKADKTWDQGQALFIERAKRNFDLKEVTSKIMSPDYVNWMRSKGIKV